MLEIIIYTLFPEMFAGVLGASILKRAQEQQIASIRLVNFRDYASDKHHTVDDSPFGGGVGMVLKPQPLFDAVESVETELPRVERDRVILLSPQGRPFTQAVAEELAAESRLSFICGHYEGFDERVRKHLVTDEISVGDYVLTGGEIAAMAITDAVIRLLPGALGNHQSSTDDSFSAGLLEYPQYTRPAEYRGLRVPETLLSGNHEHIARWRRKHALFRTWMRRRDLLEKMTFTDEETRWIDGWERGDMSGIDVVD